MLLAPALLLTAACAPSAHAAETPPATAAAETAAPACLSVEAGRAEAALGLRVLGLTLVNGCADPVTLNGYPVVRLLDEAHQPLNVDVLDGITAIVTLPRFAGPPQEFTVAPGATAAAVAVWRNTYTDPSEPPVRGTHLGVAPRPGDAEQLVTPEGPIDLGSTGRIGISPWTEVTPRTPAPTTPTGSPATDPTINPAA